MDKNKFKDILQKARVQFNGCLDNLRDGGKTVVITILLAFVIMTASCLAVFLWWFRARKKFLCQMLQEKALQTRFWSFRRRSFIQKFFLNIQIFRATKELFWIRIQFPGLL